MKKKVTKVKVPITVTQPVVPTVTVKESVGRLVPFGNEEMHKLVAFVNKLAEAIDAL